MSFDRIEYAGLTFTDDEIVDGEAFRALSLTCDALEIGTFSVELYLTDPGAGAALAEFRRNAKLLYYHREQLRGTYYVESVARTGKYTYQITANDALSLLDQSNHMGGIYTGQTVAEVVSSICNIPYLIQSKLSSIRLYGWLPIATRRSNLAQVLFAIGGVAKVDQNGVLRLETLWNGACSNIPESRVFWGDTVNYAAKVTQVSVLEHQYIAGAEEITLFEGATVEGDVIQFSEPAHSLAAQGFSILEQGANYARVSGGSGTLTGLKYVHTTRDVRVAVTEDEVPNVVEVTEATLVSLTNSAAVAQRLAAYYLQAESVEHEVIYDGESPGDVVTMAHPYGGATFGCVAEASISLGRSPVAAEKVALGYAPPSLEQTELLEERVVLTGAGSWTPPEGVTEVVAVCIGAGCGGQHGTDGENGESTSISATSTEMQAGGTWTDQAGTGGSGGKGGKAGEGGKVLRASVPVTPGSPVPYACGVGGEPSTSAEALGNAGTDTSFGAVSSQNGASSELGYTDPVTGEVYATPGNDGISGGDGGDGGAAGSGVADPGEAGASVGEWPGGSGGEGQHGNGEDSYTEHRYRYGGGAGGGAAYGAPGQAASGTEGADGANATPQPGQTVLGGGGHGGNGGGGGGGAGGLYWQNGSYGDYQPSGFILRASAGRGGTASAAVAGAPGCIILYYSVPKKIASGPVRDRTGRMVLDRLGRRIVV